MLKVEELKKTKLPKDFVELLPKVCSDCGADLEVSDTLSFLRCSNPNCIGTKAVKLCALLKNIGVDFVTKEDCKKFIEEKKIRNICYIFLYNAGKDGEFCEGFGTEKSNKLYMRLNKARCMLLWEYIKLQGMEELDANAQKIFEDYDDLNAFYTDLEQGGVEFLQHLMLRNTEYEKASGIYPPALTVYTELIKNKKELLQGYKGIVPVRNKYIFYFYGDKKDIEDILVDYRTTVYFSEQCYCDDKTEVVVVSDIELKALSEVEEYKQSYSVKVFTPLELRKYLKEKGV